MSCKTKHGHNEGITFKAVMGNKIVVHRVTDPGLDLDELLMLIDEFVKGLGYNVKGDLEYVEDDNSHHHDHDAHEHHSHEHSCSTKWHDSFQDDEEEDEDSEDYFEKNDLDCCDDEDEEEDHYDHSFEPDEHSFSITNKGKLTLAEKEIADLKLTNSYLSARVDELESEEFAAGQADLIDDVLEQNQLLQDVNSELHEKIEKLKRKLKKAKKLIQERDFIIT